MVGSSLLYIILSVLRETCDWDDYYYYYSIVCFDCGRVEGGYTCEQGCLGSVSRRMRRLVDGQVKRYRCRTNQVTMLWVLSLCRVRIMTCECDDVFRVSHIEIRLSDADEFGKGNHTSWLAWLAANTRISFLGYRIKFLKRDTTRRHSLLLLLLLSTLFDNICTAKRSPQKPHRATKYIHWASLRFSYPS